MAAAARKVAVILGRVHILVPFFHGAKRSASETIGDVVPDIAQKSCGTPQEAADMTFQTPLFFSILNSDQALGRMREEPGLFHRNRSQGAPNFLQFDTRGDGFYFFNK